MEIEVLTEEPLSDKTLFQKVKYLGNFITRAFLIAVFVFLVVVSFVVAIYFIGSYKESKEENDAIGPLFNAYVIVSPSMVPTIKINDAVVVKRSNNDYKIGDIITFLSSDVNYKGLKITHRIVDKGMGSGNKTMYTTKGDNNSISDPTPVSNESVYGKVIFKIPKIGYVHKFLSKPSNFFLCILIPATIVIIYDFIRIARMMKMDDEII